MRVPTLLVDRLGGVVVMSRLEGAADANPERLMTVEELASYLQVSASTIYCWNYEGTGPAPIRVGRWVRYRRADVEVWLDKQTKH
jgi:excisionase family DNA binding protein